MAELKTKQTDESVEAFLNTVTDERMREDSFTVLDIMRKATRAAPKMWGDSIVGFGSRRLKYESGRELDWFYIGFSPRKTNLSLYVLCGAPGQATLLKKLGKHKIGKSCLYVKQLEDIDLPVLRELVKASVAHMKTQDGKAGVRD